MSEIIHEVVQERYGKLAESGDSCCAPQFYDEAQLRELPPELVGLSHGCGNPLESAALQPGETVLDLGSGAGIDCFLAARQVGEQGRVIGVDMTPEMLARAGEARRCLGLAQVEFREGRIEKLPVEDGSIDVILSNCVISLAPDKAPVFREAFRVLRPGGRLALSDIVTTGQFTPELRANLEKWAECVTGALAVEEYHTLLTAAGFTEIHVAGLEDVGDIIITAQPDMPPLFSAHITARRPA